ncbi:hypothetical protein AU490_14390 [Lonsdalea populi]|uniref:Uncharacterized protein n=2 Tax=Lonsdalea TaxID=1082702 RepID=A0ACD1JA95_9GAMM|nr:hypothetical protein AU508_15630 [Lonsdalea populi]RAT11734.1 hypothetical protein AU485_13690 [Lonsdalea quercina]RAT14791.1 hypothetical protein AU486_11995 [Lonsdalea quercina]RAT18363.1 hypothetical protein AU487_14250 [Lonsdalea populi]RAT21763.1 hypothetical protein AU489_13980 [Lonsdalea populi]
MLQSSCSFSALVEALNKFTFMFDHVQKESCLLYLEVLLLTEVDRDNRSLLSYLSLMAIVIKEN